MMMEKTQLCDIIQILHINFKSFLAKKIYMQKWWSDENTEKDIPMTMIL